MQQEPLYISCKLSFTNCGHSESEHKKVTGYKNEEAEICGHLFAYEIYCIIPQKQATFKRPFFTTRDWARSPAAVRERIPRSSPKARLDF